MKDKKKNEFAGLEAMPVDCMDKTVAGLRESKDKLRLQGAGKIDPPRAVGSWAEAVRQLEISGAIFHGPFARISFLIQRQPYDREIKTEDFTVAEILHQAQLEIMQGRQDMASAARESGLTASEILYLRHLVKCEPHTRFAELVGKLEEMYKHVERGGRDA